MNSDQRLMSAVTESRIYQTRILLQLGARAEFKDQYGYSPLLRACQIDDSKRRTRNIIIKLLVDYGADVNTTDPHGRNALAYSCICDKEDIVNLLLELSLHDIDLNKKDLHGDTPLFHAVRNGNINIVKLVVDCMNKFHIDMHTRNDDDRTPYLEAVRLGRTDCAKLILEEGHASTTVQVNPFLSAQPLNSKTIKTKRQHTGRERIKVYRQRHVHNNREIKPQRQHITPSCRMLKRQSDERKVIQKQCTKPTDQFNTVRELEESCYQITNEVAVDPTRIQKPSQDGNLATDQQTHSKYSEARLRPKTAFIRRNRKHDMVNSPSDMVNLPSRVFLTDDDSTPIRDKKCIPRHKRSRTAPARRSSTPSIDTQSSIPASWYSHFTVNSSTSVSFLTMMMSLYGEQCSPDSSYRKGFKAEDLTAHAPVIAGLEQEVEKPSDGRRSSSGSVRSIAALSRNKVGALSRTPSIPNKKLWAAAMKTRN